MQCKSLWLAMVLAVSPAFAADYLHDPTEVDGLLRGAVLEGVYLRTQSEYRLQFNADGTLIKPGGEGRWWVNEQGQYCREWLTGRLKGNEACLDIAREADGIAIYSRDKKVAEGRLLRE